MVELVEVGIKAVLKKWMTAEMKYGPTTPQPDLKKPEVKPSGPGALLASSFSRL